MTRKNDEIIAARDGDLMSIQRLAEEVRFQEWLPVALK